MGTTRGFACASSLAAAMAVLGAATAAAQVISATAASTPEFATFPTTDSAEFRLRLVTGANPAPRAVVGFLVPQFGHGRPGWTLRLGEPRLEGPGQLGQGPPRHYDPFGNPCFRGYTTRAGEALLHLPANSTSTLVVPATLANAPPWEDTSYRLGFAIDGIRVRAPGPVRRGPHGVRIGIHMRTPYGAISGPQTDRTVGLGVPIRVFGGTRPRLRNRLITLRFGNATRDQPVLRRVLTDDQGRYSYQWRPGRRVYYPTGFYGVQATFMPPTSGSFVADESCERLLQVR